MKHIYVATSGIEGFGIRIGEGANKGDQICCIRGAIKFKVNNNKEDALANPDWVGVHKNKWIDPLKPYKFLNHSCDPNTGIRGRLTLIALRTLQSGEELTIDYSTIEGDQRWEMQCGCQSNKCRKIITSIHSLPRDQFDKYMPFVSTYFKQLYLRTVRK